MVVLTCLLEVSEIACSFHQIWLQSVGTLVFLIRNPFLQLLGFTWNQYIRFHQMEITYR